MLDDEISAVGKVVNVPCQSHRSCGSAYTRRLAFRLVDRKSPSLLYKENWYSPASAVSSKVPLRSRSICFTTVISGSRISAPAGTGTFCAPLMTTSPGAAASCRRAMLRSAGGAGHILGNA